MGGEREREEGKGMEGTKRRGPPRVVDTPRPKS